MVHVADGLPAIVGEWVTVWDTKRSFMPAKLKTKFSWAWERSSSTAQNRTALHYRGQRHRNDGHRDPGRFLGHRIPGDGQESA